MTENTTHIPAALAPFASRAAAPLSGRFASPSDQALAQAALLLAALAVGRSHIQAPLLAGEFPVLVAALRQLGVGLQQRAGGWQVDGLGVGGLLAPTAPLALHQAPAVSALLLGLLAPYGFSSQLHAAPPLHTLATLLGATLAGEGAALSLRGPILPLPARTTPPTALVKAALLLAGMQLPGQTTLVERVPTTDHFEKLLTAFGGAASVSHDDAGAVTISLTGLMPLHPCTVVVPGDPALAAYPLLAGLIVPGSELVVETVLINPLRTGLIDTLLEMGGDIQFLNQHEAGGEHVADLRVRSSRLKGVRVSAEHTAAMHDDIAVLAVAAAYAQGETVIEGLGGAPLVALKAALAANGIEARATADRLTIAGTGAVAGGGLVQCQGDTRLAMSVLLLGLASQQPVSLDDASGIDALIPALSPP